MKIYDNLISTKMIRIGKVGTQYAANSGEMITNGVELSVNTMLIQNLNIKLSSTYQNTTDINNEDIDVAFSPNILGYFKTSYKIHNLFGKSDNNNLTLSLTANYIDKMLASWDNSASDESPTSDASDPSFIPQGRIGVDIDAYFLLSTNLRFDNLFVKGLFFNFKVSNLLDYQIRYPTYDNNSWADKGMIGSGRRLLFSLGYKF